MSKLVDFFIGSNTPKYSVRKDRVPVEEKEDEKPETTSEEYSKVQTVYTAPPPQPEDKGENNLEEEEGVDNSGASQKKATPPRDNTKSVFRTGNEVGFDKALDGEDVSGDIANHDSNKGTENDNVDVVPAKTTGGTGNEQAYNDMYDVIKSLKESADEAEKESQENEAELKRTAKRRMLLAGIADAANSFHQAYAYARGIKAMNDNKGYAKEVRKELRDDLDWLRKNKDRVLNYRAKAAEIEKAIAALKKQDVETEYKWKNLERLNAEHQRLVDKDYDARMKDEWKRDIEQGKLDIQKRRLEIEEDYKRGLISLRQREVSIKELNALGKVVTKEKVDPLTGETTIETTTTKPVGTGNSAGSAGNSDAGTSTTGGTSNAGNTGKGNYDQFKKKKDYSQYIKK